MSQLPALSCDNAVVTIWFGERSPINGVDGLDILTMGETHRTPTP